MVSEQQQPDQNSHWGWLAPTTALLMPAVACGVIRSKTKSLLSFEPLLGHTKQERRLLLGHGGKRCAHLA